MILFRKKIRFSVILFSIFYFLFSTTAFAVAPTITNVSPSSGSTDGGTLVTITGSNFVSTPTVNFGTQPATDIIYVSPSAITALTPANASGSVDVTVTNLDNVTGTLLRGYWYDQPSAFTNIDFTDKWVWNEKIGWINFYTSGNVKVYSTRLEGYAYNDRIGYIALNCLAVPPDGLNVCSTSNFAVTNDGNGILSGWAWNDQIGWISFNCSNTSTCASSNYKVTLTTNSTDDGSDFNGWAWNDQIGWISFNCNDTNSCATSNYGISTTWKKASINGKLTSPIFDTSNQSTLNSFSWNGDLPNGTLVQFQFASANNDAGPWDFKGPNGTAGTFYVPTGPSINLAINRLYHNNFRYFRYRVILISDFLQTVTPRVDDIFINWSP